MSMFLAEKFVFFGEERLTLQSFAAHLSREKRKLPKTGQFWRQKVIHSNQTTFFGVFRHRQTSRNLRNRYSCPLWLRRLHSQHRQSRYRARCSRAPPGTCLRPRQGTRSHGIQSQTDCKSLIFQRNKNTKWVQVKNAIYASVWRRHRW